MSGIIAAINEPYLLTTVTAIGGLTALYLYRKQKRDFKKNAANIVLLEVQNAERQIKRAKESLSSRNQLSEDVVLMPANSWKDYKYLFVKDFDRDGWDALNDFYNGCILYDESVAYNNSLFQKNEDSLRIAMHRKFSEYLDDNLKDRKIENPDKEEPDDELKNKAKAFQTLFLKLPSSSYLPQKPFSDAKKYLEIVDTNISQTLVGASLRRLSDGTFKSIIKNFRWGFF